LLRLAFFAAILWLANSMEEPPRAVDLVNNILFTWDTDDVYMTLMNESGHRLFSILSAYKYGLTHWLRRWNRILARFQCHCHGGHGH
jgi:hypothetical protein